MLDAIVAARRSSASLNALAWPSVKITTFAKDDPRNSSSTLRTALPSRLADPLA